MLQTWHEFRLTPIGVGHWIRDDRVEADLLGVANAVGEFGEGLAVVEIRRVHDLSGSAESIGEGEAPTGQALRVMEEQNLSHVNAA